MSDGDAALSVERVINGNGESEIIAKTARVRAGFQQYLQME